MKKFFLLLLTLLCAIALCAQTVDTTLPYGVPAQHGDSVSFHGPSIIMDSTCLGKTVYEVLPSVEKGDVASVNVYQSDEIAAAFAEKIAGNTFKEVTGFRIRIFFSNSQNAREESAAAASRFQEKYPEYSVYHSFVYPNFKVTVGDFHNRSAALALLELVKRDFPSAFIVKETISLTY